MRALPRFFKRSQLRQYIVGLVALPLSAVPFAAYGTLTPEGRLVRDRLRVAFSPPVLPRLTVAQEKEAADHAPRYEGKVMALVYHGVGAGSGDGDGGFVVSPRRFGEHLATLRAAGMNTVTAGDVARAFGAGRPLPPNAVMITFDDGRTDAIMWADPLLEQAAMTATMFVISSAAAEPGIYYAGWDRLRGAARSGRWDIQAHTHDSHREQKAAGGQKLPVLTSLAPDESIGEYRQRVRDDLEENSAAILTHVGRRPVALAYPFGAYGAERVNDSRVRDVLRQEVAARFALAFHQDDQGSVPLVETSQDRVGLRRLEVGDWNGARLLERINRAAAPTQEDSAAVAGPDVAGPPVVEDLPAIPFLPELRQDPTPIPPEPTFQAPPAQPTPTPGRAPSPVPVVGPAPGPTGTTTPTSPAAAPATSPAPPTTTQPPPTIPTSSTPTTSPPTPSTSPSSSSTTTTTTKPTPTTTTKPSGTTTTRCRRGNGKPCNK